MGVDGTFYMGSYPATYLVSCNTSTGEISNLGRIVEDPKECYIWPAIAISDDGVVYCPVGLHHCELWSYDTKTGTKQQILPQGMTTEQGSPRVWLAKDGQVYGSCGSVRFLCQPEKIVTDVEILGITYDRRPGKVAGDKKAMDIGADGALTLIDTHSGEATKLQTDYQGKPLKIFCVGPEQNGKMWGGTLFPSMTFSCDRATKELTDYGRIAAGACQVYDMIGLDQGLLMGSYTGARMDLWDPSQPMQDGTNPYRFAPEPTQERPQQWAQGPDGCAYTGTIPVKGRLGGALAKVDPRAKSLKWYVNIIENQSIHYVAPVPESKQLVLASSVSGGSSAKPTEKEAFIALWDIDGEKVVFSTRPVPGTRSYGRLVRANNGLIYGLAGAKYFVFSPAERQTVFVGDLPVKRVHFPGLNDTPIGPAGLMYGLGDDALFAIDPTDHSVTTIARHPSLKGAFGFSVTADGVLYYGAGGTLWQYPIPTDTPPK